MTEAKNKIDSFFDIIDDGMDKLEGAIKPGRSDRELESGAGETWGRVEKTVYHKFPDDGYQAVCATFEPDEVDKRGPLTPGSVISVCTTCLVGVE